MGQSYAGGQHQAMIPTGEKFIIPVPFVADTEDVLEIYQRPHNPQRPLVCTAPAVQEATRDGDYSPPVLSKVEPPTGEKPDAGESQVRFGGRGHRNQSTGRRCRNCDSDRGIAAYCSSAARKFRSRQSGPSGREITNGMTVAYAAVPRSFVPRKNGVSFDLELLPDVPRSAM
jgi:hypothetical protein